MITAHDTTNLLEMAMVAARDLPAEMQGEITRLILAYPDDASLVNNRSSDDGREADGH